MTAWEDREEWDQRKKGRVVERKAYEAKMGDRSKFYATKKGALGRLAWWKIFEKYESDRSFPVYANEVWPRKVKHPECACTFMVSNEPEWMLCPIHHRTHGYYARVRQRYISMWGRDSNDEE